MKEFKKYILDNKVKVYLYSDKNLKRTYASYNVKFGSSGIYNDIYYKGERKTLPFGLAHFLEHTLIEHSMYGNLFEQFLKEGYETNGITYDELTTFYFLGLHNVKESIKKLIYMIDKPVFTKKDVEEVKYAVIDELKAKFDSEVSVLFSKNKRDSFSSIELSHESNNQLGSVESTQSISYEDVQMAYDAYYYNANKTLVIAGNFDEKEMLEYLNDIYKEIPIHEKQIEEVKHENLDDIRCSFSIIPWKTPTVDEVLVTYKIPNTFKINKALLSDYLYMFNELVIEPDSDFIKDLINKDLLSNTISDSIDFITINNKEYILMQYLFKSKNYEQTLKRFEKELTSKKLSKKRFYQIKKNILVEALKKRDFIYNEFFRFPYKLYFTDKIDSTKNIEKMEFDQLISIINSIKFNKKIVTLLRYDEKK